LIADLFDRRRLPIANSIFLASPYVGGGMALIFGGMLLGSLAAVSTVQLPLLGGVRGWQTTFLVVGLCGLAPVLLLFTMREPPRERAPDLPQSLGVGTGLVYMLKRWRFYGFFYLGMGIAGLVNAMVAAWTPTFLSRSFDMAPTAIGLTYGVYVLIAGVVGGLSGPTVNRMLSRRRPESTMVTAMIGPALILVFVAMLHAAPTPGLTVIALSLLTLSYAFPLSVAGTSLQIVTPPALRGVASAIYLICNSILGYTLGPTMVPFTTKYILEDATRIGEAMQLVGLVCGIISFISLALAARGYRLERAAMQASAPVQARG
jgi:MFS family permease